MKHFGMQGRLGLCVFTMLWQGCATLCFTYLPNGLGSSIAWLAVTSIGIHLTEGAIFGIVPYINPAAAGQMAGIVGLGGNLGGIVFGLLFRQFTYQTTFATMGIAALASIVVYGVVYIPGQSTLWTQGTSLEAMNEKVHEEATDNGAGEDGLEVPPATSRVPAQAPRTKLTTIAEA
jgi:NNP family nitrate/nitrite transporter-like MFS transporter